MRDYYWRTACEDIDGHSQLGIAGVARSKLVADRFSSRSSRAELINYTILHVSAARAPKKAPARGNAATAVLDQTFFRTVPVRYAQEADNFHARRLLDCCFILDSFGFKLKRIHRGNRLFRIVILTSVGSFLLWLRPDVYVRTAKAMPYSSHILGSTTGLADSK
jgi:hypothetical protein